MGKKSIDIYNDGDLQESNANIDSDMKDKI